MTKVDPIFTTRLTASTCTAGDQQPLSGSFAHPMDEWGPESRGPATATRNWPIEYSELVRYYPDANALGDYGPFLTTATSPSGPKMLRGKPFPVHPQDKIVPGDSGNGQGGLATLPIPDAFLERKLLAAQNVTVLFQRRTC